MERQPVAAGQGGQASWFPQDVLGQEGLGMDRKPRNKNPKKFDVFKYLNNGYSKNVDILTGKKLASI